MAQRARDQRARHPGTCGICGDRIRIGSMIATYSAEVRGEDLRFYAEHQACADAAQIEQWEDAFDHQGDMPPDIYQAYHNACNRLEHAPQLPE